MVVTIIVEERGLFAFAPIKKHQYWPTLVPYHIMQQYVDGRQDGEIDAMHGNIDGVQKNGV